MFVDWKGDLRVRAKTRTDALNFMMRFLNASKEGMILNSYWKKNFINPIIDVGQSHIGSMADRATVKIGLNCLQHYFPAAVASDKLDNLIAFVLKGTPTDGLSVASISKLIDNVPKTHNIFFMQREGVLFVRVGLFNGNYAFQIEIECLQILKPGVYCGLVINYLEHTLEMQNQSKFLRSFPR